MNNFVQRILSSFAILLFVAGAIFVKIQFFYVLIGIMLAASAYEWGNLYANKTAHNIIYSTVCLLLYSLAIYFNWEWIVYISLIWWLLIFIMLVHYVKQPSPGLRWSRSTHIVHGIMLLVPMAMTLVIIKSFGIEYLVILFIWVWATDLGGYLFGMKLGKHKLLPAVSPGKSIEGLLGSLIVVAASTSLLYYFFDFDSYSLLEYILVAIIVSLFAVIGDLYESMVKRRFGVKDSGTCIPGHGGMLDRFDSLTAAAPVLAALLFFMPS
ncbi:MAG: phosphatidate cytidylyltransferase [Legionellales bacterium]|nr:phosphatidate cytidylyltransferase [Legionellales bacterium]